MKVFGIVGWKNSGKTGLIEKLVTEIRNRGYTVSTVKHAHHSFELDTPGTDSYRHRFAGAREVVLASSKRWCLMHESDDDRTPRLDEILSKMEAADCVLIEGFKREKHPKLETRRRAGHGPAIAPGDPTVKAIACDFPAREPGIPSFDLNDARGIADFILDWAE